MRETFARLLRTAWFIALAAFLLRLSWLLFKISQIPSDVLAVAPFQNEVGNVAFALVSGHGVLHVRHYFSIGVEISKRC